MDVRQAVLSAAETVFADKSYAGATSRDLARAAGVSESAIYRHFGSKSGLFAAAVLAPFLQFLGAFTDASARYLSQPLDDEAMMRLFVSELLDQLTEHRRALRMFLAAAEDLDGETTAAFYGGFNDVMVKLGEVVGSEARLRQRRLRGRGAEMSVRTTVGMVMSLVVLDDWFRPPSDARPTRDELIEHLRDILLYGI